MMKVIEWIMPSLSNYWINKSVRTRILDVATSDIPRTENQLEHLSKEELEKLFDVDITVKDKLEDKAKTNVIGVTISVTLIMGSQVLLQNITEKHGVDLLYGVALALFVCAVMYMLAAGIHAIHILVAENEIYTPSSELKGDLYKKDLNKQINLNRAKNTLRNNYVFTSYECIRNALICLFAVMIIAIVPTHNRDNESISARHGYYSLSVDAMQSILEGVDLSVVKNYIEAQPKKEDMITVVDDEDKLLIKYSIEGDEVVIYLIEQY